MIRYLANHLIKVKGGIARLHGGRRETLVEPLILSLDWSKITLSGDIRR
jgi:hypothetical protein